MCKLVKVIKLFKKNASKDSGRFFRIIIIYFYNYYYYICRKVVSARPPAPSRSKRPDFNNSILNQSIKTFTGPITGASNSYTRPMSRGFYGPYDAI